MDAIDKLFAAAIAVIDHGVKTHSDTLPELQILKAQLAGPNPRRNIEATGLDRLGTHLPDCPTGARNPLDRHFAEAFVEAAPLLYWSSPYDDVEGGPELKTFKPHYACTVLAGPEGFRRYQAPFVCEETFIALTVQHPNSRYPSHSHFAREIYHVVAGQSEWMRGTQWTSRDSGDWIFHESHQHHAMNTNAEPLLAMVSWIDGIQESTVAVHE